MIILNAIANADIVPLFHEKTGLKLNVMISYPYLKGNAVKLTRDYRRKIGLLHLDSGAFSEQTINIHVPPNEYSLYLARYGGYFDHYYNLDNRFDDPEHNFYNQAYIEDRLPEGAKRPIPVIHDPVDPIAEVKMYVEMGHDYIALGSMGAYKKIETSIMKAIRDAYPDLRIHLFGSTDPEILEAVRPYSADSSTWAKRAGNGAVYYWRPDEQKIYRYNVGGREKKEEKSEPHIKKSPFKGEIEAFIHDKLGYSYNDLVKDAVARQIMNLYFYVQFEGYLNSLEKA